jgi:hypothetical protein
MLIMCEAGYWRQGASAQRAYARIGARDARPKLAAAGANTFKPLHANGRLLRKVCQIRRIRELSLLCGQCACEPI